MFEEKKRRRITVSTNTANAASERPRMNIEMSASHRPPWQPKRSRYLTDRILDPLEKRLGRFSVKHLMLIIVIGMAAVCALRLAGYLGIEKASAIAGALYFDRTKILDGQLWRLVTFLFIPDNIHILFVALELYIYNLLGAALEREWGSFRFNAYYFTGALCCIAAGFITGIGTNTYLNLGLFLAYALFFPDKEMLAFFVIPVKVKWLALIDGLFLLAAFVLGSRALRIVILFSLLDLLLFFGQDIFLMAKDALARRKRRRKRKI